MKLRRINDAVSLLAASPDRWMARYGHDFAIWEPGPATPRRIGLFGSRMGADLIERSLVVEPEVPSSPTRWIAAKWRKAS